MRSCAFRACSAYDRLRGRYETFANSGAVAGALARLEEQRPGGSRARTRRSCCGRARGRSRMLNDTERLRLAMHGINPLQYLRSANPRPLPLRTLAQGAAGSMDDGRLSARRRWLQLMNSIERGTRWVLYDVRDRNAWARMRGQAEAFLKPLADAGLFGDGPADEAYNVVCDERLNTEHDLAEGQVHLLVSLRGHGRANTGRSWSPRVGRAAGFDPCGPTCFRQACDSASHPR